MSKATEYDRSDEQSHLRQDHRQRSDARRNRQKILEAAERVFISQGLSASVSEIAQSAQTGIGTVYRHFPTKEALYSAIVQLRVYRLAKEVSALSTQSDKGEAFFRVLRRLYDEGEVKLVFLNALRDSNPELQRSALSGHREIETAVEDLLRAAQGIGRVRPDIGIREVMAVLGGFVYARATGTNNADSDRVFALMLDAFRLHNE